MSWLNKIAEGEDVAPERAIYFGLPGVGKTSAACSLPDAVVVPVESGLDALPRQKRLPMPESWEQLESMLDECIGAAEKDRLPYKTIVLDTLDAMEELCWEYTCSHNYTGKKWSSIEAAGYGKGYGAAIRTWRRLSSRLDQLSAAKINIVLIAHASIKKFINPEGADFDRYVMKLHPNAGALWFEWASDVYFFRHDVSASTEIDKSVPGGKMKALGQSGTKRVVHTIWDAAYDAKHRIRLAGTFQLPDPMKASFYEALLAERAKAKAKLLAGDDAEA